MVHVTASHLHKHGARTLNRRALGASASTRRAPLPHTAVRWSWLHATACSSVLVVCLAYVHHEAAEYFRARETIVYPLDRVASQPSAASSAASPATRSPSMSALQHALVLGVMCIWSVGLVVSRQYHLHSPLKRIAKRAIGLASTLREQRWTAAFSLQRTPTRKYQRRHSWGYFGMDREIDDLDTLVVTSLSPERNVLPHTKAARRDSIQTEPETTVLERTSRTDGSAAAGKQIVLHPRVGARGGRHASNQIVSDDPYVSRYHFQIQYDAMEKEYFLQDLGSTTGTFVFLKPHVPKRLRELDRVKLGDTEFEVIAIATNAATGTPFLRLCFTEGPLAGIAQTIGKTAVTLGRRSSNALCITDDSSVSGRHSVISHLGDGFYITDLESTNGTAVRLSASGEKSARRYLRHGDVFGLGSNRFLVEYSHQLDAQRGLDARVHPRDD